MSEKRTIFLVLPAYNEEASLGELLEQAEEASAGWSGALRVVVVDDGSADETAAIASQWAERLSLRLERHAQNQGLGSTLVDGIRAAAAEAADGDVVVTMDADATHPPAHVAEMLGRVDGGADIVIASRYQEGAQASGLPLHRNALSVAAKLVARLAVGLPGVRDYTCGYRAYRADLLKRAIADCDGRLLREPGFASSMELLLALRPYRPRFAEIPFHLRYDRKESASKMRIGRTVARTLAMIARRRLEALTGRARRARA